MDTMNKVADAVRARALTVGIWAIIILAIFGIVTYNRSVQTGYEKALAGTDKNAVDATTLSLVQSNKLIDVLTNTQNPNEDKDSPQNKQSIVIREAAADSVDRLIDQKKLDVDTALNTLFLLRKDGDAGVKTDATNGIAKLGGQNNANLQKVVARLSNGDPDIRSAAVDALAQIGGDPVAKSVDAVIKDPASQDSAESTLTQVKSPAVTNTWIPAGTPSVPYLVARLSDPDPQFQQQIITMLGTIGAPSAVPALSKIAQGSDPAAQRVSLESLASIVLNVSNGTKAAQSDAAKNAAAAAAAAKDPKTAAAYKAPAPTPAPTPAEVAEVQQAAPILVTALNNPQGDSEARAQAALALGRLATPDAITALVSALGDFDNRVRQQALTGVESVGEPAVAPLSQVLHSGSLDARNAAAEALGTIGTPQAIQIVSAALNETSIPNTIRERAVVGLGESGQAAAIPTLVRALGDTDGVVASDASEALLNGDLEPLAVKPLLAAFHQPTPVPFNASDTLSRMGETAIPALLAGLKSSDPITQTWSAVTLGLTDSNAPAVLQALTPLAQSKNASVQWASSQALERLSGS